MTQKPKALPHPSHSIVRGAVAGFIGGLLGTAAKSAAEKIYPPRTHGEPEPLDVVTEKLGAPAQETPAKKAATESFHWGFGALVGSGYGIMAELYPEVTSKNGATFGLTLMTVTHEGALPALGLSRKPGEQEGREKRSEAATHIVYGVVCEVVRRVVRRML